MDLRDGTAFWPFRDGRAHEFPPLTRDISCDVVVVGAGITGALTALALQKHGMDVVVLDRRDTATGSTAASTAMLQYEIDTPLVELAERYNLELATHAYQECLRGISLVEAAVQRIGVKCGFAWSPSLQVVVKKSDLRKVDAEFAARQAAGFDVQWLDQAALKKRWGIVGVAAIESSQAASVDPYALCQHALHYVSKHGGRVFDRTAVAKWNFSSRRVSVKTDRGPTVNAKYAVIATGYEVKPLLPDLPMTLLSTFAFVSEPIADLAKKYPKGILFWEYAKPYLYGRTTDDDRILIGGADERYRDPTRRAKALSVKIQTLARAAAKRIPRLALEVSYGWAGTFAETPDGLAFIGGHSKFPRCQFALGFGGNGITYSALAGEYIASALTGRKDQEHSAIFNVERDI